MSEIEVSTEKGKAVLEFQDEMIKHIGIHNSTGSGDAALFVDTNKSKYVFHITKADLSLEMLPLMRLLDRYERALVDLEAFEETGKPKVDNSFPGAMRRAFDTQGAELAELKEERKRLRDALFKIADHSWYDEMMRGEPIKFITDEDYERKYFEFIDIAKAAVGSNKK